MRKRLLIALVLIVVTGGIVYALTQQDADDAKTVMIGWKNGMNSQEATAYHYQEGCSDVTTQGLFDSEMGAGGWDEWWGSEDESAGDIAYSNSNWNLATSRYNDASKDYEAALDHYLDATQTALGCTCGDHENR